MALSRIRCGKDHLPTVLSRFNLSVNGTAIHSSNHVRQGGVCGTDPAGASSSSQVGRSAARLHLSGVRRYPEAPRLPLPSNVSEIFGNETGRFTPERSRDIAAPVLIYVTSGHHRGESHVTRGETNSSVDGRQRSWDSLTRPDQGSRVDDVHVGSYDCFGAVSLNSSMQTNVPLPYCSNGRASHFNMPGGQWAKDSKYIAEDMQRSHYTRVKARQYRSGTKNCINDDGALTNASRTLRPMSSMSRVKYSTDSKAAGPGGATDEPGRPVVGNTSVEAPVTLTNAQKLKKAVKDYGCTVIVFHVGISLLSLGICYLAISSGLDLGSFVKMISNGGNERFENAMANSSTFLVAYAVHKLLAPVRISITLGSTPFLVRYLRRVGILKMPKTS